MGGRYIVRLPVNWTHRAGWPNVSRESEAVVSWLRGKGQLAVDQGEALRAGLFEHDP